MRRLAAGPVWAYLRPGHLVSLQPVRRFGLFAAALVALLVGSAGAEPRPDRYVLPGNSVYPEGVTYERGTSNFYVSATSDGRVFRGHLGRARAQVFLPGRKDGRTTAIGLEVDRGRLFVAGGDTGRIFVYSTAAPRLVRVFTTGSGGFLNDVAVTRGGDAYFTDSLRPAIYRVPRTSVRGGPSLPRLRLRPWLKLAESPIKYQGGFNLNGIVATPDGNYLLTVQSNTGRLFRIEVRSKRVVEVDLGAVQVAGGDGLELQGRTLYAVQGGLVGVAKLQLSSDYASARLQGTTNHPSFAYPTTAALARGRLLVVNSQFDRRGTGNPRLPFTVSSIPAP
jgi:sugar lactone lactonase YvrE